MTKRRKNWKNNAYDMVQITNPDGSKRRAKMTRTDRDWTESLNASYDYDCSDYDGNTYGTK